MDELDVFDKLNEISAVTQYGDIFGDDSEKAKQIAAHKIWLQNIRHERPSTAIPYFEFLEHLIARVGTNVVVVHCNLENLMQHVMDVING